MTQAVADPRCPRCGGMCAPEWKFCGECGMFLRDGFLEHRLLLAMVHEREGHNREARQELERILQADSDNVLANHLLGTLYFHEGVLEVTLTENVTVVKGGAAVGMGSKWDDGALKDVPTGGFFSAGHRAS